MDGLPPEMLTRIAKNERSLITTLTKRIAEEVQTALTWLGNFGRSIPVCTC